MNAPVVQVKEGKLRGFTAKNIDGGDYIAFNGIPYAEPPIGDLRFKEPQSPKPWNGIRDAINDASPSAQFNIMTCENAGDEDCLYLNIATNSLIGEKPVMVWIHGGGFVMGSPHNDFHGPDYLIKHDIVLVAITYRLGCLGFLNLDIPEAAGNQGMKDLVAALKWVKENILAFGGDPNNVTIFGVSAGSASVHLLTLSPMAKGLFHKAICQSGASINPWAIQEKPRETALDFVEMMGKKTKDPKEAWQFLMNATTSELMEGQRKMNIGNISCDLIFHFVPSVDQKSSQPFMPESPRSLYKKGVNVPFIMGYTRDEGILMVTGPNVEEYILKAKRDFTNVLASDMKFWRETEIERIADLVKKYYFGDKPLTPREEKIKWSKLKGDISFITGLQQVADLQMNKITPTYLYRFSYIASYPTIRTFMKNDLEGACHGDDMGALFHPRLLMKKTHEKGTKDRLVMERMTRMWTNFAKTGDPTPELDEKITSTWKPLKKGEKNFMDIGDDLTPGINPDQETWEFWQNIFQILA